MNKNEETIRNNGIKLKHNRMLGMISSRYTRKCCVSEVLIEEMENCVYFISDGEYTKIGSAASLPNRIKQLQIGNARKLKALYVISCRNQAESLKIERVLHKRLEKSNVLGEWFKIDDEEIRSVMFELGYKLQFPTSKFNFNVEGIRVVS